MASRPPSIWVTRNPRVTAPAPRNITAWNTFVHTIAFTPSGRDVDDRDDHEDRDRRQQRPAQEMRHRHRRHREPDARAGQTGDEEEDRRRHLAGLPEAVQ